jgi:hypothetical protein
MMAKEFPPQSVRAVVKEVAALLKGRKAPTLCSLCVYPSLWIILNATSSQSIRLRWSIHSSAGA